jgi:hypothetical protein
MSIGLDFRVVTLMNFESSMTAVIFNLDNWLASADEVGQDTTTRPVVSHFPVTHLQAHAPALSLSWIEQDQSLDSMRGYIDRHV